MNIKQTTAAIRALGLIAVRNNGEWQVRYLAADCKKFGLVREDLDYFTTDNSDALETAKHMARDLQTITRGSRLLEYKQAA